MLQQEKLEETTKFRTQKQQKNSRSGREFTLFSRHCSKQPYRIFLQIQRIRKLPTRLLLQIPFDVVPVVVLHATKRTNFIQSRYNIDERFVLKYNFKVDGFCKKTNTVYEFDKCIWHGCDACNVNHNADSSLQETHPIKNIPFSQIREAMQEKKRALPTEGFRVVSIRECE